jgi:hypothetical protein
MYCKDQNFDRLDKNSGKTTIMAGTAAEIIIGWPAS